MFSKFTVMNPLILFLLSSVFTPSFSSSRVQPARPNTHSQITVLGNVYCDFCANNTFSRHSYFLPGAEVKIDCKFNVFSPKTVEQISFSVKRTTNKLGYYKLEIPAVDGIECAESPGIESACQASLVSSSSSSCNVPGYKTTSDEITIKSKQANLCIYSLSALTFRPLKRNVALCGN